MLNFCAGYDRIMGTISTLLPLKQLKKKVKKKERKTDKVIVSKHHREKKSKTFIPEERSQIVCALPL